ncbi:MAG TPA: hypothetical protein VN408_24600 [Actinoplanes sp.]|nr:hypothetical protein [Actinoplanes sp.]
MLLVLGRAAVGGPRGGSAFTGADQVRQVIAPLRDVDLTWTHFSA